MTLEELNSKCFSRPTLPEPTTLYVFETEDSADDWIMGHYINPENEKEYREYELLMVIKSDMQARYTIKEIWCKAEVEQFYVVAPDTLAVVIDANIWSDE